MKFEYWKSIPGKLGGHVFGRSFFVPAGKKQLQFQEPRLTYSYSLYDDDGKHVREGGTKKIFKIKLEATVHNPSTTAKLMRDIRLVGEINKQSYTFNLFDSLDGHWKSNYNLPAKSVYTLSWFAFLNEFGYLPGDPGIVSIDPGEEEMSFEIVYLNEKENEIKKPIPVMMARRISPSLTVA